MDNCIFKYMLLSIENEDNLPGKADLKLLIKEKIPAIDSYFYRIITATESYCDFIAKKMNK